VHKKSSCKPTRVTEAPEDLPHLQIPSQLLLQGEPVPSKEISKIRGRDAFAEREKRNPASPLKGGCRPLNDIGEKARDEGERRKGCDFHTAIAMLEKKGGSGEKALSHKRRGGAPALKSVGAREGPWA